MEPISTYHPGLSIDCVIFTYHEDELKALLLKTKGLDVWTLPGGFVRTDKDVNDEAVNVLKARTGLDNIFLRQFHVFGESNRSSPEFAKKLINKGLIDSKFEQWFTQRFVTLGYYALVEHSRVSAPAPDSFSESCEWVSINELPTLILDHNAIIKKAHDHLKQAINYQPVGLNLLQKEFTMTELQGLYETILEKSLDRRNFRRKMLGYDILIKTDKKREGVAHKAPTLYKFHLEKYNKALEKGFTQSW